MGQQKFIRTHGFSPCRVLNGDGMLQIHPIRHREKVVGLLRVGMAHGYGNLLPLDHAGIRDPPVALNARFAGQSLLVEGDDRGGQIGRGDGLGGDVVGSGLYAMRELIVAPYGSHQHVKAGEIHGGQLLVGTGVGSKDLTGIAVGLGNGRRLGLVRMAHASLLPPLGTVFFLHYSTRGGFCQYGQRKRDYPKAGKTSGKIE